MKRRIVFFLSIFFLAFSSCSKNQNSATSYEQNLSTARRVAQGSQVTCSSDDCHDSVAYLTTAIVKNLPGGRYSPDVLQCSGFLVSPEILMTNSHCVPDADDCSNLSWITFPSTSNFKTEKHGCARVISTSGDSLLDRQQDYAFIQLSEASSRPVMKISRDGLSDNDKLSIIKIDPQDDNHAIGKMKKVQCRAIQSSAFMPSFSEAHAPLATLSDCSLIEGNSGSPILDSNGQARAILQSEANLDSYKSSVGLLPNTKLASIYFSTNLACVRTPDENADVALDPGCEKPVGDELDYSPEMLYANQSAQIGRDLQNSVSEWMNGPAATTLVKFSFQELDESSDLIPKNEAPKFYRHFTAVPQCENKSKAWDAIRALPDKDSLYSEPSLIPHLYRVRLGLNAYLQIAYSIEDISADQPLGNAALQFIPKEALDSNNGADFKLVSYKVSRTGYVLFSGHIPNCASD